MSAKLHHLLSAARPESTQHRHQLQHLHQTVRLQEAAEKEKDATQAALDSERQRAQAAAAEAATAAEKLSREKRAAERVCHRVLNLVLTNLASACIVGGSYSLKLRGLHGDQRKDRC